MESVWDYIMRRKPVFLGYFALFLVSVFASCQFLNSILSQNTPSEPSVVQEKPQYYDLVLSPQAVASLPDEAAAEVSLSEPTQPSNLLYVELADPSNVSSPDNPTPSEDNGQPLVSNTLPDAGNQQLAMADQPADNPLPSDQPVDVPLTSTPEATDASLRKVSIFRTILAVLLAVTALTLAGFGLYQTYVYFAPLIDDYLQDKS